jgi:hypothetical protein
VIKAPYFARMPRLIALRFARDPARDVAGNPSRFILGQRFHDVRIAGIDVGELLAARIFYDEAAGLGAGSDGP